MTASPDQESRVYFSEVARAHWRWDRAANGESDGSESRSLKDEFDSTVAAFEKTVDRREDAEARVMDSYWCQKQASGVALVELKSARPHGPLRTVAKRMGLWHPIPEYRLYRESDWVTVEYAKLANLLHECDVLAIKARWGLEGLHEAVVMPWLMAVEEHVLGFIERDWRRRTQSQEPNKSVSQDVESEGGEAERTRFYNEVLHELNRIEDYYQQAGEKRARLHFVSSMLTFGVLIVAALGLVSAGVLALFGLLDLHDPDVRRFYASMVAGAIGAIVSVLMRMSGVHGSDFTDRPRTRLRRRPATRRLQTARRRRLRRRRRTARPDHARCQSKHNTNHRLLRGRGIPRRVQRTMDQGDARRRNANGRPRRQRQQATHHAGSATTKTQNRKHLNAATASLADHSIGRLLSEAVMYQAVGIRVVTSSVSQRYKAER